MKRCFDEDADVCILPKLLWLIGLVVTLYSSAFAAEYLQPKPPKDMSQYGKGFQRSMTLMVSSTILLCC